MKRKTYQGPKNDKERTMQKMVQSVGEVLKEKGFRGLSIANISKSAGVDRKLISVYFGSVEGLIGAYFHKKNYWRSSHTATVKEATESVDNKSKTLLKSYLMDHFRMLLYDEEMKEVLLWSLSQKDPVINDLTNKAEDISRLICPSSAREENKIIDIKALIAIMLSGVSFIALHSKATDSTFCDLDIRSEEGISRIEEAMLSIIDMMYV